MEGFFDHGNRGHIWLDNMDMSSSTMLEDCTRKCPLLQGAGRGVLQPFFFFNLMGASASPFKVKLKIGGGGVRGAPVFVPN